MGNDVSDPQVPWKVTSLGDCCDVVTSSMSYTDFLSATNAMNGDVIECMGVKVSDMNLPGNGTAFTTANAVRQLPAAVAARKLVPPNTVVFPKRGAAIATNKKRMTTTWTALDPNLIGLRPKEGLDEQFLFYWSQTLDLRKITDPGPTPQLNKKDLLPVQVTFPASLIEQRQIALLLSAVQRAIDRQGRLIALTAELKKALMHTLFTKGTRSEPLKQTEIGPVPESWTVRPLGTLWSRPPSNGLYLPQSSYGRGTLILRIDDFSNDGEVITTASNRVTPNDGDCQRFGLAKNDIVLNRVNSLSHLGKAALIGELAEPLLFESNMMRFRVDEKHLRPVFAFRVLNSTVCKAQIVGAAKRAVAQSSVNQGDVARLLIPLPPDVKTQDQIVDILASVEAKSTAHARTRASLNRLFRMLLHQLMTAQIRVNDADLSALDTEIAEAPVGVAEFA
jgi:type I restriction enzyme, S subunit